MADLNLVVASVGGWEKPSTAYRMGPLQRAGYGVETVAVDTFPSQSDIDDLCSRASDAAILVLRRVLPRPPEMRLLRTVFRAIVFDMDDAIYAVPPRLDQRRIVEGAKAVGRLLVRGSRDASSRARPLRSTLASVDICVVGNSILGKFAAKYATRVYEVPTTTRPISASQARTAREPIIVWLGVPANLQYLELVSGALRELSQRVPVQLRVVSSRRPPDLGVSTEFVEWSPPAAEAALLSAAVGIAPLTDNAWTRGKCAFRAIQYGAHGLPTVASPVGITSQIVVPGTTGYLARTQQDWITALRRLTENGVEAAEMGANALDLVTQRYSDDVAVARWRELFSTI